MRHLVLLLGYQLRATFAIIHLYDVWVPSLYLERVVFLTRAHTLFFNFLLLPLRT